MKMLARETLKKIIAIAVSAKLDSVQLLDSLLFSIVERLGEEGLQLGLSNRSRREFCDAMLR